MQTPKDIKLNHATLAFVDSLTFLISASLSKYPKNKTKNNTSEKLKSFATNNILGRRVLT